MDEGGKQLIGDIRAPLPVRAGSPAKEDSEYQRNGIANLFMAFEPLAGRRVVEVTARRTAVDFATLLKRLLDEVYPTARRAVLVTDNLNTHCVGSLYEAFAPTEARRLAERIEWHYTPKQLVEHGGDRVECAGATMSGPADTRHRSTETRGGRLTEAPQRGGGEGQLAIHHR